MTVSLLLFLPAFLVHSTTHSAMRSVGDTTLRDSTRRDSVGHDTTRFKPLVTWADSDSVVASLLKRPGFRATRYQGKRVVFDAQHRALRIEGDPAAVGREQTLVVGDTVIYNDSTKIVVALGDTVILRDPTQQSADVVSRGRVAYNVEQRRGQVSNVSTSVESGERYFIQGHDAAFVGDTSKAKRSAFYVRNGMITSCDDSIPDYYFKSHEIKYVSKNLIVARPAVLYVAGVPVMWLPFLFQDVRSGRRSGILTPRFGLSEFVRNSPSYRRQVENVGYFVNLGNYMDAIGWFDWRSRAAATDIDPGYTRWTGELRYRWLDRFTTGRIAMSHLTQSNGTTNTAFSLFHTQDFSLTSHFSASLNYVTNTTVQRTTTFDPRAVFASIRSDARYSRKVGPFSLDLGGQRTQYPGRTQTEENYPTLSLTSPTLAVTSWLDWTPGLNFTRTATRNNDQTGTFAYRYFTNANGQPDSVRLKGSSDNSTMGFTTPFSIKGFQISAGLNTQDQRFDYPQSRTFVDPTDTTRRIERVYARSFLQTVDWNVGFGLPTLLSNTFRLSPSVSFENVGPGAYWVRSELSGGQYVHQSKRVTTGLNISPTFFGLFPGIGPVARIRHSLTPSLSYRYAPSGHVSNEYLQALNINPNGYLGSLPLNQVSLGLSQVFEAKLRSDTSSSGEGRKIKLLALNFSPLTYDFERARRTNLTGLVTTQFSYDLTSDLLPGATFRSDYSLFQGNISSDTAKFKPYREQISAAFTLNGQSGVFALINRLFGRAVPTTAPNIETLVPGQNPDEAFAQRISSLPVAGSYTANRQYQLPDQQRWSSEITFASTRQRPPKGGNVASYDPTTFCNSYRNNPAQFALCQQTVILNPQTSLPLTNPIAGGLFVVVPPRETITARTNLHITPKWSAVWGTTYDAIHREFASQDITLQRDLHDWRALFSFSSIANGNYYFSVSIVNKAQPQLNIPYRQQTTRQIDVR